MRELGSELEISRERESCRSFYVVTDSLLHLSSGKSRYTTSYILYTMVTYEKDGYTAGHLNQ